MIYDIVIIGGGPAGLTAAVYAARYKLNVIVIVAEEGGLAATAHLVCNFPSYTQIPGRELMDKMKEQVTGLDVPFVNENVTKVIKEDGSFVVATDKNVMYRGKKLIIATGTKRRKLQCKGEESFYGKGVSYCATCDAAFYKDAKVGVVGGSDAALTAALLLAEFAGDVTIIYRGEKFSRAEPMWIEAVEKNHKIKTIFNETVEEIKGDKFMNEIVLGSGKTMKLDGIFIEIGSDPASIIFKTIGIGIDEKGYIITSKDQRTNVDGIFAAGDITNCELKQIVTACAQGATAAYGAYKDLISEKD